MPFSMVASMELEECYMNFSPGKQVWMKCKSTIAKTVEEGKREHRLSFHDKKALMAEEGSTDIHQQSNSNNHPQQPIVRTTSNAGRDDAVKLKMEPPLTEELDIVDRDPTSLNTHVRVGFEEVFAEPYDMHSFTGVWETSYVVFVNVKFWCYRILSAIFGIPFALCWGVYFACLTFCHIWYVVPFLRGWVIALHYLSRLWAICIRTFCDPFFESLGKIFSGFRIYMNRT